MLSDILTREQKWVPPLATQMIPQILIVHMSSSFKKAPLSLPFSYRRFNLAFSPEVSDSEDGFPTTIISLRDYQNRHGPLRTTVCIKCVCVGVCV